MRFIQLSLYLFLVQLLPAQKLFDVKLNNCLLQFEMESAEAWIYYEPNDSILIQDFLKGLEAKHIDRLKGGIQLQIMVDTVSNICCVSYTNKTTLSDRRMEIPLRVEQMKGWKRHPDIKPEVNLCALVSILFENDKYTVIRTGYDRNKGKQILSHISFNKYPADTLSIDTLQMKN